MARRRRVHKTSPKTPSRVKKRRGTKKPRARRPAHAHHYPELIGLALGAIGIFLAAVLWLGFSGGPVGDLVRSAIGAAAYIAPLVLVPLGVLMVAKSELIDVRPFRLGLAVALTGLLLTLGTSQGGVVGDGLESLAALGLGTTGARILGVLLTRRGHALPDRRQPRGDPPQVGPRGAARAHDAARDPAGTTSPIRSATPVAARPGCRRSTSSTTTPTSSRTRSPARRRRCSCASPTRSRKRPTSRRRRCSTCRRRRSPTTSSRTAASCGSRRAGSGPNADASQRVADALVTCLAHFGVEATVIGQISGPRVTRYELQLAPGTKVGKVANLKDDLSYALATTEIRILAPIPGKQAVGVEVPNLSPSIVTLGDIYDDLPQAASPLSVWLGKDISGAAVWADLARMPHILIAGTTGSGKSGCINTILTSILLRATPDEARLILIDPKRIELNHYESIPHLLTPVVSSPKEASAVLLNVVTEMERRYERLSQVRARNLAEANRAFRKRGEDELPYLLVVIDELADLMMVSPQEVEDSIIRLAQKSRAVGIHLVLATQRPSVDVITGMIKANVPSRIAFAVSSQTDSRVILDSNGAESLLGQGDMLFKPLGTSRLQRVQGAFVTEEEIALIVEQTRTQREQVVDESFLELPQVFVDEADSDDGEFDPDEDPLLDKAIEVVVTAQTASVSLLQRRLRVGYTRAGRLVDMLERRGIISPYEGSKPRRVLISEHELERVAAPDASD